MILFKYKKLTAEFIVKDFFYILVCNTLIAVVFALISDDPMDWRHFRIYFIVSNCMGFSIGTMTNAFFFWLKPEHMFSQVGLLILTVVGGAFMGSILAGRFVTHTSLAFLHGFSPAMVAVGIILGFIIAYMFIIQHSYSKMKLFVQDEKLKRLSVEKEKLKSDLKLLQAQIEPHFLFNTLSNVLSLWDENSQKGKTMLENLTRYLRTSLVQSRKQAHYLKDEIKMIQTYLDIFKIRMEERLDFDIQVQDTVLSCRIPPMIIQPLVENAIKHGIEPRIDGGEIMIDARVDKGRDNDLKTVTITVTDTGDGIQPHARQGVGNENIKQRLSALYGNRAGLMLEEHYPHGVRAVLEIPYETD